MSSLYQLTAEYMQLQELAEDPDVSEEVLLDTMDAIEGELEDKAEAYAMVLRQLDSEALAIKSEEDRLSARRKVIEANMSRIKARLQDSMEITGKTKFKTALFSFGIQKNPPSVQIEDTAKLPVRFQIPQPPKADKKAILAELKAGKKVEGCELVQGQSLRIR